MQSAPETPVLRAAGAELFSKSFSCIRES